VSKNYTDTRQKLAFIIRDQRRSAGWSQEEFAEKAQIDRTYVSQIERGVANPSLSVLCKIADVFEMQLTELLND
jgi:transcriptional regulator with XRE-family HTH domain